MLPHVANPAHVDELTSTGNEINAIKSPSWNLQSLKLSGLGWNVMFSHGDACAMEQSIARSHSTVLWRMCF